MSSNGDGVLNRKVQQRSIPLTIDAVNPVIALENGPRRDGG